MSFLDYVVLAAYFVLMIWIGRIAMRRVKAQEDYFMGGRQFGKWLQAFAAFGAGTGSSDPVNTARTSFTSGMSGIWSTMSWLFVTPFYWITGVWYRRMRHMTLGDWFAERYESKAMGAAYTLFGILFYIVYGAMFFSAIGKVAAPLLGNAVIIGGQTWPLEYFLVPIIAIIVIVYGVLGGLTAAYWTDMVQGIFIIILSIMLVPFGLDALIERFGDPATDGMMAGFRIMHEQLPSGMFQLVGSANASEFPLYRIIAVTVISLVGVVIQPHFIATGGGSAKTELNARVGLVAGNLAKRFCTIGWAITALIVLALYADNAEVMQDPGKAWGVASRELLAPGLRGLMLACLLAALMSSADTYMLVSSALIVRNIYIPFVNKNASESTCLTIGRATGMLVILGAAVVSLLISDVFELLQLTWIVPILFAAPFWIGIYWRRASTGAAWFTLAFTALFFFIIPWLTPVLAPGLKQSERFTAVTDLVTTKIERTAAPSDIRRRSMEIEEYEKSLTAANGDLAMLEALGRRPEPIQAGQTIFDTMVTGGKSIYWSDTVYPLEGAQLVVVGQSEGNNKTTLRQNYEGPMQGKGSFRLDFLIYDFLGLDLKSRTDSMLATMELPTKIVLPFLVMIAASFFTRRNSKEGLDRYYSKMKTPVNPDPEQDKMALENALLDKEAHESRKWIPGSDLEIEKPKMLDILGFLGTFAVCFLIIGLAIWIARIGS
ncbi:MAG: sodium:solute symporter family protein [Verrucomicrobia bacterium]|jgi:solute:Na+ symporter, SSS family|nr:sodium:solute symporter family protein [Verrucomicrobiota bacterium]